METIEIKINQDEWYIAAEKLFIRMSGLWKEGAKFEKMRSEAAAMIRESRSRVEIKAVCEYFDDIKLAEGNVVIGGEMFACVAFQQIEPGTVKGAFVYALSAGDFGFPDKDILNQVYADLWGTALAETLSKECRKELEKRARLSDSFGPGFYGMDVSHMEKVARILDFKKLGLEVRNSSVILPLKSCAGIYFHVTDAYQHLKSACADCLGTYTSCVLCQQEKM